MSVLGYCGLGHMGGAIARKLAERNELLVFDLDPAKRAAFAQLGCATAATAAEFAASCDIAFLCLPATRHVEEALFGRDGMAGCFPAGTLVVDQTSGDPLATPAIADRLSAQAVAYVDAPVSGGPGAAAAGRLAIMAGGAAEHVARAAPLLRDVAQAVHHVGPVGAGHALKVANNLITATQRLVTLEALSLAVARGVNPTVAVEVLSQGSARNYTIEHTLPAHILSGRLFQGCALEIMHKDIATGLALARDQGYAMPFAEAAEQAYAAMMEEHGAATEVNAMALTYERVAGVRLTPPDRSLDP